MVTNSKEFNKKNYKKYWGTKAEIKKRSNRNKARRMIWLKTWDPREVDHVNGNANDNRPSNLKVISRITNRRKWQKKATRKRNSK